MQAFSSHDLKAHGSANASAYAEDQKTAQSGCPMRFLQKYELIVSEKFSSSLQQKQ
jgi:hypothetical protein